MPVPNSGAREGLAIAAGVLALSALLAWRQWRERQSRDDEEDLSAEDALYFARRDYRRWVGTTILALIGAGMFGGSLLDPRANRIAFLAIWLGVGGLVCVSLVLAMIDWSANRGYALRHRKLLIQERRAMIEEEIRRRLARPDANGQGSPH